MNEKLPSLQKAIEQLESTNELNLAKELKELTEELSSQIEKKHHHNIEKVEAEITEFLEKHEKTIHIDDRQGELTSLKTSIHPEETGSTSPEEKKGRRSGMSEGRKKFWKWTGITVAATGVALRFKQHREKIKDEKVIEEGGVPDEHSGGNSSSDTEDISPRPGPSYELVDEMKGRQLPYPPPRRAISSEFGKLRTKKDGTTYRHGGVDVPLPKGTPLYPILPGVVARKGFHETGGNFIVLKHTYLGSTRESKYMHLKTIPTIATGTSVTYTDSIGLSGNTGSSTGPHLHLELRKDGKVVNPETYVPLEKNNKAALA